MLTTLQIVDRFYAILHGKSYTNLYMHSKPLGDVRDEYIVINALSSDAETLQECQINVNYHCKDIHTSKLIPDHVKLNTNASGITTELDNYYDSVIDITEVFQSGPISEPELQEHFINMRFTVRTIN